MRFSMKLVYKDMAIFINFSTTLSHLHPLRLVVDEMTMVNSGFKGLSNMTPPPPPPDSGHFPNVGMMLGQHSR